MKHTEKRIVTIESVDTGDIFQWIKDKNSNKAGQLMVVARIESNRHFALDVEFVAPEGCTGCYGSLKWLSQEMTDGNIRYAGTIKNPDVLSIDHLIRFIP